MSKIKHKPKVIVGRKTIRLAADAAFRLDKLGPKTVNAYTALRAIDDEALGRVSLLLRPLARLLINTAVHNLEQSPPVRSFTAAAAIRLRRVPESVVEQATSEGQKDVLIAAARRGDLGTVKALLRHNARSASGAEAT